MALERGDLQFANNYTVLHTRTGFEDWPEPHRRRTLWRLWLAVDGLRPRTGYSRQWAEGVSLAGREPRVQLHYEDAPSA